MRPPIACCHRVAFLAGLIPAPLLLAIAGVPCTAAESGDGFLAWLRDTSVAEGEKRPRLDATVLGESNLGERAYLFFAVAGTGGRYAYLRNEKDTQVLEVRSLTDGTRHELYHHDGQLPANTFTVLDAVWSPDGDRLMAKFGYRELDRGPWFPLDPSTGEVLERKDVFEALRDGPLPTERSAENIDEPVPVWTLGGKRFAGEFAARRAGFTRLFRSWDVRPGPMLSFSVRWAGRRYDLSCVSVSYDWHLNLVAADKLVGSVALAAPIHQSVVVVRNEAGRLIAKPISGVRGYPADMVATDLGVGEKVYVIDLAEQGLVYKILEKKAIRWVYLRKAQPASEQAPAPE